MLQLDSTGSRFPRVVVRECHVVPAGVPVGLFAGHVLVGPVLRGDYLVALPPVPARGGVLRLGVDAAASLARFPAPSNAGLYTHDCEQGNLRVVAEWHALDSLPFSVLVAVSDAELRERAQLCWNFDHHGVDDVSYTLGDEDGQDWCAAGGGVRECDCAALLPCPLGRFLRAPCDGDASADSAEEADWTAGTDGWQRR